MQKLTKAEEDIMHYIWQLERCLVSDILDILEKETGTRPPHSSISSIVRILESKDFVGHKAYGKTHEYFPLVTKAAYGKRSLSQLVKDYFDGSPQSIVSFLVKEENMDADQLRGLLEKLDDEKP
jgi:BlaI family transcriptional regulator, penicillinase repressor